MIRIIDGRGTGKTSQLMELASKNHGVLVCSNKFAMTEKAKAYGFTGFDIISYEDYYNGNVINEKPVYVDELENLVKVFTNNHINGYTLSNED